MHEQFQLVMLFPIIETKGHGQWHVKYKAMVHSLPVEFTVAESQAHTASGCKSGLDNFMSYFYFYLCKDG